MIQAILLIFLKGILIILLVLIMILISYVCPPLGLLIDIRFMGWGIYDFIKDPSAENAAWLAFDIMMMFVSVTGIRKGVGAADIVTATAKLDDVAEARKVAVSISALEDTRPQFNVMKFDDLAIAEARAGDPSFKTFKNRLFAAQERLHPRTFDSLTRGLNPAIGGNKVILHHPQGRTGTNLYNVVGVSISQHKAIHAIIGYRNARWAEILYNLGNGVFR
jgi:hypothetical protein